VHEVVGGLRAALRGQLGAPTGASSSAWTRRSRPAARAASSTTPRLVHGEGAAVAEDVGRARQAAPRSLRQDRLGHEPHVGLPVLLELGRHLVRGQAGRVDVDRPRRVGLGQQLEREQLALE
jgi:hypothetical protein